MKKMRMARLSCCPSRLIELYKSGSYHLTVVTNALPVDAEYLWSTFDPQSGLIWLFITSASYELVPEGGLVPVLSPPVFEIRRDAELRPSATAP